MHRRGFLASSVGATASAGALLWGQSAEPAHLSVNLYGWVTFFQRDGRDFLADLKTNLAEVRQAGFQGFEPSLEAPADAARLAPLVRLHGLEVRSFYANSLLHREEQVDQSIRQILETARSARDELGAKIVVTNPSPIRWGGTEDKSDVELRTQAAALNRLGAELGRLGMVLAYHHHDSELRQAAREFHHMLLGTDPERVRLCLDTHWIYRGAGNSHVAVQDVITLYADRIDELHLRQSSLGTWSEVFGEGDLDYPLLLGELHRSGVTPHVVLEQAAEPGTPHSLSPLELHRRSTTHLREISPWH